jgi:hypothetical protein
MNQLINTFVFFIICRLQIDKYKSNEYKEIT